MEIGRFLLHGTLADHQVLFEVGGVAGGLFNIEPLLFEHDKSYDADQNEAYLDVERPLPLSKIVGLPLPSER